MKKEFAFEYTSYNEEYRVIVSATNLNSAMIKFAKFYHAVDMVHSIQEIVPLYKHSVL